MLRLFSTARVAVVCLSLAGGAAHAAPVTINSTDSVYNYGGTQVAGQGSTTPPIVAIAAGTTGFVFSATGLLSLTPGTSPFGLHGPDGSPPVGMNVLGAAGLSGIVSPNVGYVAGVFLNGAEGSQPAPAALDFSAGKTGEDFASLAPAIDQVFFIGDGLTGTGSGAAQQFAVPAGATRLVLGIVDAYGYNGVPGAYYDNSGSFLVNVTPVSAVSSAVPEAAIWAMFIGGFGLVGAAIRRRRGPTALRSVQPGGFHHA